MTEPTTAAGDEAPAPAVPDEDRPAAPPPTEETTTGRHRRLRRARPPKSSTRNIVEWVAVVVGALVVALVVRTFLFQAFFIPSPSMLPTLKEGDRVIVNKLSYEFGNVSPGDIIVFERPPGVEQQTKDLIKRVVATEGDRVALENGKVVVNGKLISEPYVDPGVRTDPLLYPYCRVNLSQPITVPKHNVLVMGDNRANSLDGRCFGPIDENLIVGRAFVRIWPLGRLSLL